MSNVVNGVEQPEGPQKPVRDFKGEAKTLASKAFILVAIKGRTVDDPLPEVRKQLNAELAQLINRTAQIEAARKTHNEWLRRLSFPGAGVENFLAERIAHTEACVTRDLLENVELETVYKKAIELLSTYTYDEERTTKLLLT
jgi:hypothetical protein